MDDVVSGVPDELDVGGEAVVSTAPDELEPPPDPSVSVTVLGVVVNVVLVVVPVLPAVAPIVVVTPDTSSAQAETTKGTATRPILKSLFNMSVPSSVIAALMTAMSRYATHPYYQI
ncbi:MAG: hypothetical protein K0V04_40045 [Deltaproteobacteria bacterium]|nr:hypothetical protein [Deltaproteobacteria bacterium]